QTGAEGHPPEAEDVHDQAASARGREDGGRGKCAGGYRGSGGRLIGCGEAGPWLKATESIIQSLSTGQWICDPNLWDGCIVRPAKRNNSGFPSPVKLCP